MEFSSLTFISVFLPAVFIIYYIIPSTKIQNGLLIIASLLFYAYGEPVYVLLMICSGLFNYLSALGIDRCANGKKRILLSLNAVINVGCLIFFKYTGMLLTTVNGFFGCNIHIPDIPLPLGISFFTFQAMSYVIDVYRGISKSDRSFFRVLLYISFFPQLIAGPIVKYHEMSKYLESRTKNPENIAEGFRRFCYGLAKKVLIANVLGMAADSIYDLSVVNAPLAWIGAISYMLQIYFDFSGYSDMAIGLGRMFGFSFPENFNYPYIAGSIKDFWRRWHITLSSWFKEYLYIPLGGNRKGRLRTGLNKFIVFFCTGLWHGANWTFVIWGLFHGIFSVLEDFVHIQKNNKLIKFLGHIYALLVVCIGFVIFRSDSILQAWSMIKAMFSGFYMNTDMMVSLLSIVNIQFIVIFVIAVIFSMPVKKAVTGLASKHGRLYSVANVLSYCGAVVMLVLCILSLSGGGYNPFIYFRF